MNALPTRAQAGNEDDPGASQWDNDLPDPLAHSEVVSAAPCWSRPAIAPLASRWSPGGLPGQVRLILDCQHLTCPWGPPAATLPRSRLTDEEAELREVGDCPEFMFS